MSAIVTQYPQVIIHDNPALVSGWNAVHQPIKYLIQRQDLIIDFVFSLDPSNMFVDFTTAHGAIIGDQLFIYSNSPIIQGVFTVIDVTGPNEIAIVVSEAIPVPVNGGYANYITARPNYYLETSIYGVNVANQYYLLGTSINKPSVSGLITVDVSAFLRPLVDYEDTFQYVLRNEKDRTLSGRFNIKYQEFWTGGSEAQVGFQTIYPLYYVNSAQQIQSLYGSNMGEYVPVIPTVPEEIECKFLSDFTTPTYFKGYPFSLSFIYSDMLVGNTIFLIEVTKDVNGTIIDVEVESLLNNSDIQFVNRLTLTEPDCDVATMDVYLANEGFSCVAYLESGYVEDGYVEEICSLTPIPE